VENTANGWITERRLTRAAQVLLAVFLMFWALWFARFAGIGDSDVPNVDFIVYWTAAKLGTDGDATLAYDPDAFETKQTEAVGDNANGFPWVYPPVAFVLVLPLALLSYGAAFAAWLVATGAVFITALRRLARGGGFWLALAFPATLFNLIIGQAGLLTAGLFAWAMLLLPSRPVVAGALLGVFAFKPHFMPLILLALLAGRQVKALGATVGTAGALMAVSLVAFGDGPWREFVSQLDDSTALLYGDVFPVAKMQSVTALVLALGGSDLASQAVQGITTLAAAGFVFWLWRRDAPLEYKAAGLGLAALLATPYVYHYDLTVMGVAMLFFANRARLTGWQPWERPLLAVAWFAPIISLTLGIVVSFTVGAPILLALAAMVVYRVRNEDAAAQPLPVIEAAAA
jgi:alpha-1,2-mannosyltransferase